MDGDNQMPLADMERSDSRISITELTEVTVRFEVHFLFAFISPA